MKRIVYLFCIVILLENIVFAMKPRFSSTGTIRALAVFIKYSNDDWGKPSDRDAYNTSDLETEWPYNLTTPPFWADSIISSVKPYADGSISQFFDYESQGNLHVIGSVYDSLVIPPKTSIQYKDSNPGISFTRFAQIVNNDIASIIFRESPTSLENVDLLIFFYRSSVFFRVKTLLSGTYFQGLSRTSVLIEDGRRIPVVFAGDMINQREACGMSHEIGHELGLDHTGSAVGGRIGMWGMMDGKNGNSSMHAFERMELGWLHDSDFQFIDSDASVLLHDSVIDNDVAIIPIASDTSEFFIVENRQRSTFIDSYLGDGDICNAEGQCCLNCGTDRGLPGEGLIITHIQTSGNGFKKGFKYFNFKHIECADGDIVPGIGDAGDTYNEGEYFSSFTTPNSDFLRGGHSWVSVYNIDEHGEDIRFSVAFNSLTGRIDKTTFISKIDTPLKVVGHLEIADGAILYIHPETIINDTLLITGPGKVSRNCWGGDVTENLVWKSDRHTDFMLIDNVDILPGDTVRVARDSKIVINFPNVLKIHGALIVPPHATLYVENIINIYEGGVLLMENGSNLVLSSNGSGGKINNNGRIIQN